MEGDLVSSMKGCVCRNRSFLGLITMMSFKMVWNLLLEAIDVALLSIIMHVHAFII